MINNSKRKGFISILVILVSVLIGAGIVFYFMAYPRPKDQIIESNKQLRSIPTGNLSDKRLSQPTDTPLLIQSVTTPSFFESNIDITKIPNNGRLYLALNLPDRSTGKNKINVFVKAPENSQIVYNLIGDNDLGIWMKVNGVEYNIKVPAGGTEGSCSAEESDNQCWYIDEEIQTLSPIKINKLRIWKRENGAFLLDPFSIEKDNFYINHLEISKVQPDKVFKEQEVAMWRDILKSVSFEEAFE